MGLHKGRLKHFNIWLFNPNCIHIFHLISSITLLGILFFFFQEFQVYALGSNKTYNEVNLREFYLWKYSWKRKEKKKAYKDLARFWRVCDEFSWVYKPTWISSLPYTRVCVCVWVIVIQGMKRCCVVLDIYEELWFQFQKNQLELSWFGFHTNGMWMLDWIWFYAEFKFWFQFWKSVPICSNSVCTNQNWNGHNSLLTKVGTHPTL